VGCGDGKRSSETVKKLLGVLFWESIFARNDNIYQKHHPPEKFPNLALMQTDASKLTFDSDFDIAFSNATFHG
jgi:hypothetical protein